MQTQGEQGMVWYLCAGKGRGDMSQASHTKRGSGIKKASQVCFFHHHLTTVHEMQQRPHLMPTQTLQHNDGMVTRMVLKM